MEWENWDRKTGSGKGRSQWWEYSRQTAHSQLSSIFLDQVAPVVEEQSFNKNHRDWLLKPMGGAGVLGRNGSSGPCLHSVSWWFAWFECFLSHLQNFLSFLSSGFTFNMPFASSQVICKWYDLMKYTLNYKHAHTKYSTLPAHNHFLESYLHFGAGILRWNIFIIYLYFITPCCYTAVECLKYFHKFNLVWFMS